MRTSESTLLGFLMAGEEDEDLGSVLEEGDEDSVNASRPRCNSGGGVTGGCHYNQQNHNIPNHHLNYQGQSQANGNGGHSLDNSLNSHSHNHSNHHHGKSNGNSRKAGEMNHHPNNKKSMGLVDLVDNTDYEATGSSANNSARGSRGGRQRQTGICDIIEAQLEHLGKG